MRNFTIAHVNMDEKYKKEWNVRLNDFVYLVDLQGNLISNTRYRDWETDRKSVV